MHLTNAGDASYRDGWQGYRAVASYDRVDWFRVPTEYHGAAVEIGFNAQYLLDFLSSAGTAQVSLELRDQESQGMLLAASETAADGSRKMVVLTIASPLASGSTVS